MQESLHTLEKLSNSGMSVYDKMNRINSSERSAKLIIALRRC